MEAIEQIGEFIDGTPYFPVLHTIHCLASTASIRSQPGAIEFAHDHPMASMATNLMIINAGGLLTSAALSKPMIGPFGNVANTFTAIFIWWLLYFGPGDLVFRLYKVKPFQMCLMVARETRRCKKILDAVRISAGLLKGQWINIILVGMLGGCSGKFLQTTEESIRNKDIDLNKSELFQLSFVTKASLCISTLFTLAEMELVYLNTVQALFICSFALVAMNLGMAILGFQDPFHPIARATWKVVSITSSQKKKDAKGDKKKE